MKPHASIAALTALCLCSLGSAQVALDSSAGATITGAATNNVSSFTVGAANTNRMLVVVLGFEAATANTGDITGITWGTQSLTQAVTTTASSSESSIWYLANPDVGNLTLQISSSDLFPANSGTLVYGIYSLYNASSVVGAGSTYSFSTLATPLTATAGFTVAPPAGSFGIDVGTVNNGGRSVSYGAGQNQLIKSGNSSNGYTTGISSLASLGGADIDLSQSWADNGSRLAYSAIYVAAAVPEPSAFASLAGLAVLGSIALRRRRCA